MLKFKKMICIFSLIFFTFTLFACSNQSKNDKPGTEVSETATPKKAPDQIFVLRGDNGFQKKSEQEEKVHEKIKELANVDVQMIFVPNDQLANKLSLMLSSGENFDIALTSPTLAKDYYSSGATIGLTEEMLNKSFPNWKKNIRPSIWTDAKFKDIYLGIPNEAAMSVRSTLQVRPDWIKKLGMNMPKTIEDIEKVFDAFKNKDPDGNGKNDTVPLVSDGFDSLAQAFAPAFLPDEMEWWVDKNGKLMPPEMHPAYKELLSKLKEWYKKGYIYSEDHIAKIEQKRELMAQNKVGVFTGWWTSLCYSGLEILVKSVPDANLEPIVLNGKGSNKYSLRTLLGGVAVIPKKSKNLDAVLRYIDLTTSVEGYNLAVFGIENENYKKLSDGTFEFLDASDKTNVKTAQYYGTYYLIDKVYNRENPWPLNTWLHKWMTSMWKKIDALPTFEAQDRYVSYDTSKWKSVTKLNDLSTYLQEQKLRVFLGEIPIENWDSIMDKWLEIGGQLQIDDKTTQYKEQKK